MKNSKVPSKCATNPFSQRCQNDSGKKICVMFDQNQIIFCKNKTKTLNRPENFENAFLTS